LDQTTIRPGGSGFSPQQGVGLYQAVLVATLMGGAVLLGMALWQGTPAEDSVERPLTDPPTEPSLIGCSGGSSFYVAPDGPREAGGAEAQPMSLHTALSSKSPAKACDTIWLQAGVYSGTFATEIGGREGAPIVVRARPGERVIIDSAPSSDPAIAVNTNDIWLWGLEIANSDPKRTSAQSEAWPTDLRRGSGVVVRGSRVKLINLVIHDNARGIDVEPEAAAAELYGNLIFHNGWDGPAASHGNGIETQNQSGVPQVIADNVIFNQFSHGILALGSDSSRVDNLKIVGNVVFNNGLPARGSFTRDLLVGGTPPAGLEVRDNATFGGAQTFIGYGNGCADASITGNYFVGSTPLLLEKCPAVLERNTLFGQYGFGALPKEYPSNTYEAARPHGVMLRTRRNRFEPGRSHVAIYNWDKHEQVGVNLVETGLAPRDQFEIVDVQTYGQKPLVTGIVPADGMVQIPMSGKKTLWPNVPHTAPDFTVLLIRRLGVGNDPAR
jgi:hypothetical protein